MPLGHVGISVPELPAAKDYYDSVMPLLGYEEFFSTTDELSYRPVGGEPGIVLFFYPSQEASRYSRRRSGLQHLAFIVTTRAAVHAVHEHARALRDTVLLEPQEFPQYHPGYFAVFWVNPFGHMLEAVCHRDSG